VLDLLLDLSTYKDHGISTEWPASVVRARSKEELAEITQGRHRFNVIVADDALEVGQPLLDALAADGAVVHRIGVADEEAILLDVPHRQQDAELASLASGQQSRWLGAPDGIGLIVRTAPDLTIDQLISAGNRLVQALRNAGCVAFPATSDAEADFIVASIEELKDSDLQSLATRARKGVAVLCRSDGRTVGSIPQAASSPEVMLAQSIGWKLISTTADGALLEKDGRSAVLVDESIVMDGRDETVADVARRLEAMGWHPIVSWRSASRTPEDLGKLLNDRAVATNRRYRTLAETLDLKAPEPPGNSTSPGPRISADILNAPSTAGVASPSTDRSASDVGLLHSLSGGIVSRTSDAAPALDENIEGERQTTPTDGVIGRPSLWIAEDFWVLRFRLMVKRGP
jgi:hypothetical protein